MKAPSRRKQTIVNYKGWTYLQVPWSAYGEKQYAKYLFDSSGKERMHAGYSRFCHRKKMRQEAKKCIEMLEKLKNINWEDLTE